MLAGDLERMIKLCTIIIVEVHNQTHVTQMLVTINSLYLLCLFAVENKLLTW